MYATNIKTLQANPTPIPPSSQFLCTNQEGRRLCEARRSMVPVRRTNMLEILTCVLLRRTWVPPSVHKVRRWGGLCNFPIAIGLCCMPTDGGNYKEAMDTMRFMEGHGHRHPLDAATGAINPRIYCEEGMAVWPCSLQILRGIDSTCFRYVPKS